MGHDWAYSTKDTGQGFIVGCCLRCGAKQLFYIGREIYEPDLDDDCSEEQNE